MEEILKIKVSLNNALNYRRSERLNHSRQDGIEFMYTLDSRRWSKLIRNRTHN